MLDGVKFANNTAHTPACSRDPLDTSLTLHDTDSNVCINLEGGFTCECAAGYTNELTCGGQGAFDADFQTQVGNGIDSETIRDTGALDFRYVTSATLPEVAISSSLGYLEERAKGIRCVPFKCPEFYRSTRENTCEACPQGQSVPQAYDNWAAGPETFCV